jgi:hypothetical protein
MASVTRMCPPMLQHLDEDIGSGHAGAPECNHPLTQDQGNLWPLLEGFDDQLVAFIVCAG